MERTTFTLYVRTAVAPRSTTKQLTCGKQTAYNC